MKKLQKYNETALELISKSEILEGKDFKVLGELRDELKDSFLYSQVFRTRTEMEVSVLNEIKFPTPDSKYWQAVKEQNVMFQELVFLSYEYRKNLVEIKKLDKQIKIEKDKLEKELLSIEREKKIFISKNQEKTAKDRIREIKDWHEIKEQLIPQMKYSVTDLNEHQLVSYTQRWIKQAQNLSETQGLAERNNLIGQLKSGIKECQKRKLMDKVLLPFEEKIKTEVKLLL